MRRRPDNYAVWVSPLWAVVANALRCYQELGAWHRTEEPHLLTGSSPLPARDWGACRGRVAP